MQVKHSAILSTFIKLPFDFKTIVLSIFEWPLKTGLLYTVPNALLQNRQIFGKFLNYVELVFVKH